MLKDVQRLRNSKRVCHWIRGRVCFSSLLDAGNDNYDGCLREVMRILVPDPATVNIDGEGVVHLSSNEFTFDKSERHTNTSSWTFSRHRHQAYSVRNIEEIVSVAHRICMVYYFVADVKVGMDDRSHETSTFKKPYEF